MLICTYNYSVQNSLLKIYTIAVPPPPTHPMENRIETDKVLGKAVPMDIILSANPVYGAEISKS